MKHRRIECRKSGERICFKHLRKRRWAGECYFLCLDTLLLNNGFGDGKTFLYRSAIESRGEKDKQTIFSVAYYVPMDYNEVTNILIALIISVLIFLVIGIVLSIYLIFYKFIKLKLKDKEEIEKI